MGATRLVVRSDSQLITQQLNGKCEVRDERMKEYVGRVEALRNGFQQIEIQHIPHEINQKVDLFSKIGSSMTDTTVRKITMFGIDRNLQLMVVTNDPNYWRAPLMRYIQGERTGSSKELAKMERRFRF